MLQLAILSRLEDMEMKVRAVEMSVCSNPHKWFVSAKALNRSLQFEFTVE